MNRKRKFIANAVQHIYQRSPDCGNIFYEEDDYLVLYMIISVIARKHNIIVLGLCIMPDHIHLLVIARSSRALAAFVSDYSKAFAREYNTDCQRVGAVFEHSFGSASKTSAKKIRTAIAYLYNNPVEKRLAASVQDYKWNFISYAENKNPYSQKIAINKISRPLKRSILEADALFRHNLIVNYRTLRSIHRQLKEFEFKQFSDYLVFLYEFVDYKRLISFYGSYEKMLLAINSNSGSEYDIDEKFHNQSDMIFCKMSAAIKCAWQDGNIKRVTTLSKERKEKCARYLLQKTAADKYQIMKFLHLFPDR